MMSPMRKLRLLKGLTLADVWLKTQIHMSKLSQIERGIFKPNQQERRLISKALGISEREIFSEK